MINMSQIVFHTISNTLGDEYHMFLIHNEKQIMIS